jgi:hypothetical protein
MVFEVPKDAKLKTLTIGAGNFRKWSMSLGQWLLTESNVAMWKWSSFFGGDSWTLIEKRPAAGF